MSAEKDDWVETPVVVRGPKCANRTASDIGHTRAYDMQWAGLPAMVYGPSKDMQVEGDKRVLLCLVGALDTSMVGRFDVRFRVLVVCGNCGGELSPRAAGRI